MNNHMTVYCPKCDTEVNAQIDSQPATLSVRGEDVDYSETVAVCPLCGQIVGDARIESANLERAYAAYRTRHRILSPGEVKALRNSYGLSLREFSKFLGFGEQTAYRYERGDIPDQPHNTTMLSAKSVEGARLLLKQNGSKLNNRSRARVEYHIQTLIDSSVEESQISLAIEMHEADGPSAVNGYRSLDLNRVAALVFELANRCPELYWTKLQKAVFFVDMVSYERNSRSLTGMSYAHATYGPVMDRKDEVRCMLVNRDVVDFREYGWGEVLIPKQSGEHVFSAEELSLIDEVAEFVNSFKTAGELSEFSHQLSCWDASVDGEIIEYTRDNGEVGSAMLERMQ